MRGGRRTRRLVASRRGRVDVLDLRSMMLCRKLVRAYRDKWSERDVLFSAFLNFLDASSGSTLLESSSSRPVPLSDFPRPCPLVGAPDSSSLESPFYRHTSAGVSKANVVRTDAVLCSREGVLSFVDVGRCVLFNEFSISTFSYTNINGRKFRYMCIITISGITKHKQQNKLFYKM